MSRIVGFLIFTAFVAIFLLVQTETAKTLYVSSKSGSERNGEVDSVILKQSEVDHVYMDGPEIFLGKSKSFLTIVYCEKSWTKADAELIKSRYSDAQSYSANVDQVNGYNNAQERSLPFVFQCKFESL